MKTAISYESMGRKVFRLYPRIAELLMAPAKEKKTLIDYSEISFVVAVFSEYYKVDFESYCTLLPFKELTDYRVKFTAVCLYCFDPESIKGPYFKKLKNHLRELIAETLAIHQTRISQYVPKARVYLQVYPDFYEEVMQLVSCVKSKKLVN